MSRNHFYSEALLHHLALKGKKYNFNNHYGLLTCYTSIIRIRTKFNIFSPYKNTHHYLYYWINDCSH